MTMPEMSPVLAQSPRLSIESDHGRLAGTDWERYRPTYEAMNPADRGAPWHAWQVFPPSPGPTRTRARARAFAVTAGSLAPAPLAIHPSPLVTSTGMASMPRRRRAAESYPEYGEGQENGEHEG